MGTYIKNNILNIGESDDEIKKNMKDILRYIYHQYSLNYDKMKALYEHVKVPIDFDDNDSNGIDYCDYYRHKLTFVGHYNKDDTYIYEFDKYLYDYYENELLVEELHNFLLKNSPKNLHLDEFKYVILSNHHGINNDARGIRCLDWKLYFWEEFNVYDDAGITLHNLIIAAYKIKSHKFENYYELFCDISDLRIDDDCLYINAKFDHES
jgi:hypothetical protein